MDFNGPDEIPVDDYCLLFRACAGDLLWLEDLYLLNEGPDDLSGQFRDVRVLAHHSEEGVYIQPLFL